ncbi:hypothetical protein BsWGS_26171 [Bradybaena similaris]
MAEKNSNTVAMSTIGKFQTSEVREGNSTNKHVNHIRFKEGGRSKLEKVLFLLVVALLVTLVAVVVVLIVRQDRPETIAHQPPSSAESTICLTKECIAASARINKYIDYSVDYCENFYQFSCGRWLKDNVIPEDLSSFALYDILDDQVEIVLKNLIEEEVRPTDLGSVKKAKDFYRACMNLDRMNSRGDQPLRDLLMTEFGGWPLVTTNWSEANFDLGRTLTKVNSWNIFPVIALSVWPDNRNSSKHTLKIDQPSFGMPGQKYYQVPRDDCMLVAYEELIFQVGQLLGFVDESLARREVAEIVDFEILLAHISVPDESRRDGNALYNPMTLSEVHGNYSQVLDWQAYIRSLLLRPEVGLSNVTDDEIIINQSPLYYERLDYIIATTPKRVLANYVIWRFVQNFLFTLGDRYTEHIIAYRKALFGTSRERARFRTCVARSTQNLGLAVGRMFIKDNFDTDARTIAVEMIRGLQDAFNKLLDDLDWMDDDTKKVAREKNEHISAKIGYPEEITNDTYLENYYTNFTYNKEQFFENMLAAGRENFHKNMRRLRQPVDKTKWESPPPTVNAFYSAVKNQIMFPAGILQPPLFSKYFPKSLNYGGIGMVIGHEITHGFDDRGRQYDRHGNLVQWWSQSSVEKFKEKVACIVEQYSNFTLSEANLTLNGINTQGENIADNGGLKQAFKAYRNWVSKQGKEEPLLPGLDFTNNQLFFINFAQLWCMLMTEGDAINAIKAGFHSPAPFRAIGAVQNSPDFAKAFKCPVGSYMNPQRKCSVW